MEHPFCGTDLAARDEGEAPAELHTLLQLQQEILLKENRDPHDLSSVGGMPTTNHRYFTDLGIVASLTLLSWPTARYLSAAPALATLIDTEVDRRRHEIRSRQLQSIRLNSRRSPGLGTALRKPVTLRERMLATGLPDLPPRVVARELDRHLGSLDERRPRRRCGARYGGVTRPKARTALMRVTEPVGKES
ncbi:hypothetical protein LO762_15325 [Actinocorallia sp. API 0066]|uniref:hypothetical protein n=1 Tax=Actinocorallia sp. API 0066 TaxID=2896846 RepID=UPI001E63D1C1|nr:hypothetical protein [Actinocorallia sp. API 0066]MCD0450551.1 hypothetical protein [Actinocorallia sp. API 0066]